VEGAPVHGPQLDGCGSDNGGRPGGLEQQSCVSKHPAGLHVDLDLTTFKLQIKNPLMACQDVKSGRKKLRFLPAAACVLPQMNAWGSDNRMLRMLGERGGA